MNEPRNPTPLGRRTAIAGFSAAAAAGLAAIPSLANAAPQAPELTPQQVHGTRNSLEFGNSSMTDEARLRIALAYFTDNREEVVLTVSRRIVLTDTLIVDTTYVSLQFTHGIVDARAILDRPAMIFTGSSTSGYPYTRAHVVGLRLLGPGSSSSTSMGILFEAATGKAIRGVGFYGLEVSGFSVGLEFRSNAYLLSFFNFHVYRCGTGIHMPAGHANYGENLKFIGGGIGTSDVAVLNANPNGNFHLVSTSIDFCRVAVVSRAGGVFLSLPHIEFNETGAQSTSPHFVAGRDSSAKIVIDGGHLFFHSPPAAPAIFMSENSSWGGGIHISRVALMSTSTTTGFLASGPGKFMASDLVFYDGGGSGSGMGALMPNPQSNKLLDGSFLGATVTDAFVNTPDATSRTASPSIRIRHQDGKLVIQRLAAKAGSVAIDIPVEHGKIHALAITFAGSTASGTLGLIESFVAVRGSNAAGVPIVVKSQARGTTNITANTINASPALRRTYAGGTWDRTAPPWATHYRLRFLLDRLGVGEVKIDEVVVTAI